MAAAISYGLFFLPLGTKDSLRLFSGNATVVTIFGNNYIHFDYWGHLIGNLMMFVPVGIITSLLFGAIRGRRVFYEILLFNMLVTPLLVSSLWLGIGARYFSSSVPTYGFSGIVAAFAGALVVSLLVFLRRLLKFSLTYSVVAIIAFIPLSFSLTYIAVIGTLAVETSALLAIFFLVSFYMTFRTIDRDVVLKNGSQSGWAKAVLLATPYATLLIFTVFLFPEQVIVGNAEVNVFVHYFGLIIGIISSVLLSAMSKRVNPGNRPSPRPMNKVFAYLWGTSAGNQQPGLTFIRFPLLILLPGATIISVVVVLIHPASSTTIILAVFLAAVLVSLARTLIALPETRKSPVSADLPSIHLRLITWLLTAGSGAALCFLGFVLVVLRARAPSTRT